MPNSARYIFYSPAYHDDAGGVIAIHKLCDLLNARGLASFIYPLRPQFNPNHPLKTSRRIVRNFIKRNFLKRFETNEDFDSPLCTHFDREKDIVIYPETVFGNPLGAKRIVRWLLHKPGYFTGRSRVISDELIFYYQKAFFDAGCYQHVGGELKIMHVNRLYENQGRKSRSGHCYILRKGRGRNIVHDASSSILIDGKSHAEIADIFNRVEMCISYDSYTMYSRYAAACGCLSVVVPEENLSKEQWRPEEELRWGIAYGFDDLEWARNTQSKVLPSLLHHEQKVNNRAVDNFITKTQEYFG